MSASAPTVSSSINPRKVSRINRWDSPWLNSKLITGLVMVVVVMLLSVVGPWIYDTKLALPASSPINLPPAWCKRTDQVDFNLLNPGTWCRVNPKLRFGKPTWDHPIGTESSGRDMLAVLMVGSPRSLRVGLIAAAAGVGLGILLGFSAGFLGGWVDTVIRTLSDSIITIPSLVILIVISAYMKQISVEALALLLAGLSWAGPTRLIRAQVLTLRERGYVNMARLSGASTFDIMFKEIMPNLLPYLASSFTGNVSGAILAITGLEVLGLGPTRLPTLGMTIFYSISASAILRGMWWWWGVPIVALIWIFTGLFQITIGLDEIANPRLRGAKPQ